MNSPTPHRRLSDAHLTDAQFTELLLGSIPDAVTAHLDACPQCAHEAQRLSSSLDSFSRHSLLWAEHRAAARPLHLPARRPVLPWLNRPAAWSAAAATVVLATFLGISHHNEHPTSQPVASIQSTPPVSPATLKADNDLLSAINGELSADAAPSPSLYGLNTNPHASRSHSLRKVSN